MKLPRWLMISMLTTSVLGGLGIPAWWWLTWPGRTAREFVELIHSGKTVEAQEMILIRESDWDRLGNRLGTQQGEYYPGWLVYLPRRPLELKAQPRWPADMIRGEQEFSIGRKHKMRIAQGKIISAKRVEAQ